jgi:tetratricopeptide (TPR) repeat protein
VVVCGGRCVGASIERGTHGGGGCHAAAGGPRVNRSGDLSDEIGDDCVQDDPHELGAALSRLASVAWRRGDFDGAIAYHKQALPLFEQAGAEALLLTELHWLGDAYRDRGDFEDGERLLEETATRARELGFHQQLTSTLHSLGDLSLDRSDPDPALRRFAEALEYAVATGSRVSSASPASRARCSSKATTARPRASGGSRRTRNAGSAFGCSLTNGGATST